MGAKEQLDKRMKSNQLFVFLIIAAASLSTVSACCCMYLSSCRCNIFGCNCDTHDGGYCYSSCTPSDTFHCCSGEGCCGYDCCPDTLELCDAFDTKQLFDGWDLNKDGLISAEEALEYGNLTLTEFSMADKDQNGFVFPSEFDSDLAEFDSGLILT